MPLHSRTSTRSAVRLVCAAISLAPAGLAGQTQTILTGRVTAEGGAPVTDATVEIRALNIGARTRADGRFTLTIPAGQASPTVTVTVRRLGYRVVTREVALRGGTVALDLQLVSNPLQLGEIVVTGAGTTSTSERLGAIRKTVDSSAVRSANEVNLVTALAGKAAGVQVRQQSGEAGGGARVQIRGVRAVQGTGQPLFIVDGVPVNNSTMITGSAVASTTAPNRLADLNPADIESLEVLSGPSAAAVYGSLAGDGVVIITTKKGRAGRTTASVRSTYSSDRVVRSLPFQRRYGVGTGGVTPTCVPGGPANCFLSAGFFSWGAPVASDARTWNQADEIFTPGSAFDNTLQLQGGTERTTFLASAGALTQDGYYVTSNDRYRRYTGRLNASHRASASLTVGGNVAITRSDLAAFGRGNNVNGLLLPALRTPPNFDNRQYLADGLHRSWRFPNPAGAGAVRANRSFDNPFYVINAGETAPQAVDRTLAGLTLKWTPLAWFSVDYSLGSDVAAEDRLEARPEQSSGTPVGGSVTRWEFTQRIIDHNLTARAEHQWTPNLTTRLLLGQQLNQNRFRQLLATGNTLIAPLPYRIDNTTTQVPPTDAETTTRLESYFGQVQVDVARQLFLTLLARNDGSSTFGTQTNRIWYPNAQLAWTPPWAERVPGLSALKLRAAYGESGSIPNPYQLQSVFLGGGATQVVDFNPGAVVIPNVNGFSGLVTSGVRGNARLRPARQSELEVGGDVAFWDGRADLGVSVHRQRTRDGIINVQLAPASGYLSAVRNGVRMWNRGVELQGSIRPVQTADWRWEVGGNFARNRNRVTSLGDPNLTSIGVGSSFNGRTTNAVVGEPLGVIRGTDFARCRYGDAANVVGGVDVNGACRAAGAPDGALYIAASGFPIADPTERTVGDPNPRYTAGARSSVTWRRLTLATFVDVRRGGTIQNMTKASMYSYGIHGDTRDRGRTATFGTDYRLGGTGPDRFPVVGPGAGKAITLGESWYAGVGGIGGPITPFQEDGSFARWRELSLALTLDQPWVQRRLGAGSVELRIAGRNLALWTDYTGFDPETSLSGGAVISQGFDWFNAPTSRSLVFSVGITR